MLIKNCNNFDFTHKPRFKTLMHDTLGRGRAFIAINQVGALCICTLCTFLRLPLVREGV